MVFREIFLQVGVIQFLAVWSVPAEGGGYWYCSLSPQIVRDDLQKAQKSWETPISLRL